MKIGFTNSKKMWMMIRYEVFNLNSFVLKIGIASIPVTKFDPSVGSVPISISSIEIAIRQD